MTKTPAGIINVTERQFVVELLRLDEGRPKHAGEAYERSFGKQKSEGVAKARATRLLGKDYIRNEVSRIERQRALAASREASQARGFIEETLRGIITLDTTRDSDRIAALRELRQLVPDTAQDDLSTLERHELIDRIRLLLASQLGLVSERVVCTEGAEPPASCAPEGGVSNATGENDTGGEPIDSPRVVEAELVDTHPPSF